MFEIGGQKGHTGSASQGLISDPEFYATGCIYRSLAERAMCLIIPRRTIKKALQQGLRPSRKSTLKKRAEQT